MESNILENSFIQIKEPSKCSENEINKFHELVIKGGKVKQKGLLKRIRDCEILAFCFFKNQIIGISSIKRPGKTYIEDIICKTEIDRSSIELNFEIGYSFTEPDFRKNGISTELKNHLLKAIESRKGIIFSTTGIESSQRFLQENGFKSKGNSYDGEYDKDIMYFEKEL